VLDRWLRERLTPLGWLAGAAAAAAAGGIDLNQTLTAQAFTFFAACSSSRFLPAGVSRARRVAAQLPRYATAGEDFVYRVTVTNRGTRRSSARRWPSAFATRARATTSGARRASPASSAGTGSIARSATFAGAG
jgi:hypothetical protein